MSEYGHYFSTTKDRRIVRYTIVTNYGKFFVKHGQNKILKSYPCMTTDAGIDYGLVLPDPIPPFDSFIHAVRFMKENALLLR